MNYYDVSYELILFDNALLYSHYVTILIFRRVTFQSMYKHNKALKLIYSYVTKYFRFITKRVSERAEYSFSTLFEVLSCFPYLQYYCCLFSLVTIIVLLQDLCSSNGKCILFLSGLCTNVTVS